MTAGARTPEELDTLIEDAFLRRDRALLDDLFDDAAVLVDGGAAPARGREAIGRAVAEMWDRRRTYLANPRQVLQARDTVLVVADAGIHVLRRGGDGTWRATISLLGLDRLAADPSPPPGGTMRHPSLPTAGDPAARSDARDDHDPRWRQLQHTLRKTDAAIHAITSGDPQPYIALWDTDPDATLFGAWGPIERGPGALIATFEWVGARFGPQGGLTSELTVVEMSDSLAYTVGFERGMAQVDGRPPVPMTIRVTHVYRYTHGEWRLMHRHADFPPDDDRPATP